MLEAIIYSAITAAVTGIVGGLITSILNLSNRIKQKQRKEIDDAIAAVNKIGEKYRNELIKTIEETPTKGTKTFEKINRSESDLHLVDDIVFSKITKEGTDFVQELITEYHLQALSQAKAQFWFSLIAASAGFAYILYAITLVNIEQLVSIINILPGVVIDAVAALFFVQAEKTRQRATELYDRLRMDINIRISQKIINLIQDKVIKSITQAQIALHLAGLEQKEFDMSSLTNISNTDK